MQLSIIIPLHNEEENIPLIYNAIKEEINKLNGRFSYEMIFVNDGSDDNSQDMIEKLAENDPIISYIEFSRNFGKEMATTAGLHETAGDAAIIIDADLQHPPSLIQEFIRKWDEGFDMVIGVREKDKHEGIIKRAGSGFFYAIMNAIGETKIVRRSTDFRLIDRRVIDEFKRFSEHNRITRGLLDWLGFRKEYVYFKANERQSGRATYNKLKLLKLAVSSFVGHSLFPLKIAGYLGVSIIIFSGPLGLFIFIEKYLLNDPYGFSFSGPAILAVINLFLVGIMLSCLGLIALYIGNIQYEVKNRPMYVIRRKRKERYIKL
jgi:polyisoprenyl-phosphate glycosyltransferase